MCLWFPRWWTKAGVDLNNPSLISSYWPVSFNGWAVGDPVSVPTSVLDLSSPRRLAKIEFISGYNQFADVIFPIDPAQPTRRLRARVPVAQLIGGPISTDLSAVAWHEESAALPVYGPRRPRSPSVPLDLEANAIPEVLESRDRVLSDPSTCLSGGPPAAKIRKIEPVDAPGDMAGDEREDKPGDMADDERDDNPDEKPGSQEEDPVLKTDQDPEYDPDQFFSTDYPQSPVY